MKNSYFLAKIGADTAENERHFAENLPKIWRVPMSFVKDTNASIEEKTRQITEKTSEKAEAEEDKTATSEGQRKLNFSFYILNFFLFRLQSSDTKSGRLGQFLKSTEFSRKSTKSSKFCILFLSSKNQIASNFRMFGPIS